MGGKKRKRLPLLPVIRSDFGFKNQMNPLMDLMGAKGPDVEKYASLCLLYSNVCISPG